MNRRTFLARSAGVVAASSFVRDAAAAPTHVTVWRETGRYGGWPANHGIWSWGDEILVGFTAGVLKTGDPMRHPIDRSAGESHVLSRSRDGGLTWQVETPAALQPPPRPERRAVTGEALQLATPTVPDAPIDFTAPDLAITFRAAHTTAGAWMFVSTDRGREWRGPYAVPAFDTPGLDPRTDYVVVDRHELLVFMTAMKTNGKEGRPLAVRTRDGGRTWERLGWIGPETDGYRIMPATVAIAGAPRLSGAGGSPVGVPHLFTAIRRHDSDSENRLEGYQSPDGGETWEFTGLIATDTGRGNPASLVRLRDGRLCCVYGFRKAPFGMRYVLSTDGRVWSAPQVLHAGANDWDLGYPRTVVRPDGTLVTVYYFNDPTGPERYIAATLWKP